MLVDKAISAFLMMPVRLVNNSSGVSVDVLVHTPKSNDTYWMPVSNYESWTTK
jgi:hypothetical protein